MHPLIAGYVARVMQDEARKQNSVWRRARRASK